MSYYFEKNFQLRYFEMNNFGEASPTTILTGASGPTRKLFS